MKTLASARLDSLASAAFRLSRAKCVEAIKRGQVQLNWEVAEKPGREVVEGDVVTFRGKGRAKVWRLETNRRDRVVCEFSLFK